MEDAFSMDAAKIDYFTTISKEVWREIAAGVVADLRRYALENDIEGEKEHPVNLMCHLIWLAKDNIFRVTTDDQFHEIIGQIKVGQAFVKALGE